MTPGGIKVIYFSRGYMKPDCRTCDRPIIKRVPQPHNYECFAAVAAMLTGDTLEQVFEALGHDGSEKVEDSEHPEKWKSFTFQEICKYLIDSGWHIGIVFDGSNVTSETTVLRCDILISSPALLEVESERLPPPCTHMVMWDGTQVLDPNPEHEEPRRLEDYKIIAWWPLMKFTDDGEWR